MASIEVGSGFHPDLSFTVHCDLNPKCPHLEYCGSVDKLPYPDNSFEKLRASDILEHFSYRDTIPVLREWYRVLEPNGTIYIQCPDAKLLAKRWLENDLPILEGMPIDFSASYWIMGGHYDKNFARDKADWKFNAHYALFSKESLTFYMTKAGFRNITIGSDGGSNLICEAIK